MTRKELEAKALEFIHKIPPQDWTYHHALETYIQGYIAGRDAAAELLKRDEIWNGTVMKVETIDLDNACVTLSEQTENDIYYKIKALGEDT